jgi:LysB family phage lysis regulatory protein
MSWIYALVLALGFGAVSQYQLHTLRADLAIAHAEARAAQQSNTAREGVIHTLQESAQQQNKAIQRLQSTQEAIRTTYSEREENIRRAYDTDVLQAWAATPLPVDIVRLRTHGPYTSAADYFPQLPACASLPVTRKYSKNER